MAKKLKLRTAPPDDPMFLGGPSLFSARKFKPSSPTPPVPAPGKTPPIGQPDPDPEPQRS